MDAQDPFFREMLDHLNDAVYLVDRERRITFWNRAAEMLTGYPREEIVGSCCGENILRHVNVNGKALCPDECPLSMVMATHGVSESLIFMRHKGGHRIPIRVKAVPLFGVDGQVVGALEVFDDDRSKAELEHRLAELERLALLDTLTGLPNRRYLEAQLGSRLDELRRYGWPFGAIVMDVDEFKSVNDHYGHQVGDEVIKVVGKTLSASSRMFDTVGRWGGDEFLAVVANVGQRGIVEVGERFRALVATASIDSPRVIRVTISAGAALALPDDTPIQLLERADTMLYRAKNAGRNRVCA